MNAHIITIGDELLIGQVVDTNSAWIAQRLDGIGIKTLQITSVQDYAPQIQEALEAAVGNCNVVLITGGLGPTKDDITKPTLARFFNSDLVIHQPTLENISRLFKNRGLELTELNMKQAMVPQNCSVIINEVGTAPGMWFEKNGTIVVSMPGVPFEMKSMMENHILPQLSQMINGKVILHKTVLTHGIGESFLSDLISNWEDELPANIRLAYLPSPGMVRLRLTATGEYKASVQLAIETEIEKLSKLIPQYIWGFDDDTMEALVGRMLLEKNAWVATAESCTGGYVAHRLTSVPGSSAYFKGSVVAYSNEIKEKLLGVSPELLISMGAVSGQVVSLMAENCRHALNADYAIAVSGIAGPGGGTDEKPVGTVWVAVAGPHKTTQRLFLFGDNRERNIIRTGFSALNMLREMLLADERMP